MGKDIRITINIHFLTIKKNIELKAQYKIIYLNVETLKKWRTKVC